MPVVYCAVWMLHPQEEYIIFALFLNLSIIYLQVLKGRARLENLDLDGTIIIKLFL
jgi:hypothetical protein